MSQVEIRHLRTLVALRETGSLVEASERMFLTQSALSHQIKELEGRLGCSFNIVISYLNNDSEGLGGPIRHKL